MRQQQPGERGTADWKIPHRDSRTEEQQVSGLFPPYLFTPSSRYVDVWLAPSGRARPHQRTGPPTRDLQLRAHSEESRRLGGYGSSTTWRRFSFVLQQALSFRTRYHLGRQRVCLTSSNSNDRTRLQEREWGFADGTSERRVGGTASVESTDGLVCGESIAAAGNHDLQQLVTSLRQEICRNRGITSMVGIERRTGGRCERNDTGKRTM